MSFKRSFWASEADTFRYLLLNLVASTPLTHFEIKLNGKIQLLPIEPGIMSGSYRLGFSKRGENTLEVGFRQPGEVEFFLDGYLEPVLIQGAGHWRLPAPLEAERRKSADYEPGIVELKFLEGMRTRVIQGPKRLEFIDLNGLDLGRLNRLLHRLGIQDYAQFLALGKSPEEMEEEEKRLEAYFHREASNPNLFYTIYCNENLDIWEIVDQIRQLPYFESVHPRRTPQSNPTAMPRILSPN